MQKYFIIISDGTTAKFHLDWHRKENQEWGQQAETFDTYEEAQEFIQMGIEKPGLCYIWPDKKD
jgi:hypothetical protein